MEFMEYCEKFAAPGNGTYFYSLRGGSGSLDNLFDFIFTYANQDQLFDKEGNCVLNQPVFAEALDAYASIYWNGWVSKDSVSNSFKEMVSEFGSGTSLSIAHNSSSLAEHQKNLGEGSFMNALAPSNEDGFIVTKDVPFLAYAVFEAAKKILFIQKKDWKQEFPIRMILKKPSENAMEARFWRTSQNCFGKRRMGQITAFVTDTMTIQRNDSAPRIVIQSAHGVAEIISG